MKGFFGCLSLALIAYLFDWNWATGVFGLVGIGSLIFGHNKKKKTRKINIHELTLQYQGTKFRELVQHHLDDIDALTRHDAIQGHVDWLPEKLRPLTADFIDRWLPKVLDDDFLEQDTALVFSEVIDDARAFTHDCDPSDEDLFHIFNILLMSFALNVGIHLTDFGESLGENKDG